MTESQLKKLQEYLETDRLAHMKAYGSWSLDLGKLRAAVESTGLRICEDPLSDLRDAFLHYRAVQRRGHSEFVRKNGRFGSSPWAELIDQIEAALEIG